MPGSLGSILCRTGYIDDVIKESLKSGLDQVVILGTGDYQDLYLKPLGRSLSVFAGERAAVATKM